MLCIADRGKSFIIYIDAATGEVKLCIADRGKSFIIAPVSCLLEPQLCIADRGKSFIIIIMNIKEIIYVVHCGQRQIIYNSFLVCHQCVVVVHCGQRQIIYNRINQVIVSELLCIADRGKSFIICITARRS